MKKFKLGILLTTLVMLGCTGTPDTTSAQNVQGTDLNTETVRIGSIDWYVDYDAALAEAKSSGRPVWLHFGENPG